MIFTKICFLLCQLIFNYQDAWHLSEALPAGLKFDKVNASISGLVSIGRDKEEDYKFYVSSRAGTIELRIFINPCKEHDYYVARAQGVGMNDLSFLDRKPTNDLVLTSLVDSPLNLTIFTKK